MAERFTEGFIDAVNAVGSVKTVMANGTIHIFDGTQPATADLTETGYTLLAKITDAGLVLTPGVATNGINFDISTAGVLALDLSEDWKGAGTAAAGPLPGKTATWFRHYDNSVTTGEDDTAIRYDGQVGDSSIYELAMSNRVIVEGGTIQITEFNYAPPKQ